MHNAQRILGEEIVWPQQCMCALVVLGVGQFPWTLPPGQFPLPFWVGHFPPDNSPHILCIHTYTCMHTHYTHIHTYTDTYAHIHTHIHIHKYIYMHTYTC